MTLFKKVVANTVFCLQVLIVFFLLFQDRLVFPSWLQSVGRLHPLLVHFPIGYLLVVVLFQFFKPHFKKKSFERIDLLLLHVTAVTSSFSACMGIMLSAEGGYEETLLSNHLISSVILSFAIALLLLIRLYWPKKRKLYHYLLAASTLNMIIAGHLGASLTHGENFLTEPLQSDEDQLLVITDSTSLYAMAVEPILKKKCMSCHNEKKSKGDLAVSSIEEILRGGEHGVIWVAGQPDSSEMIIRAVLPEDHDDHMPPAGKPQLNEAELELLQRWIASGADVYKAWTKYTSTDTLVTLARSLQGQSIKSGGPRYTFSFASEETLEKLNSPYCTVVPIASQEPALKADFYLASQFKTEDLQNLQEVKEQLIHLNLSGMPVTDTEANVIVSFINLEKLNLNNTKITGRFLGELASLRKLTSLSLDGTAIDFNSLQTLKDLPELKEVYIWNTALTKDELRNLRANLSRIKWIEGYRPIDKLKLTPPILVNENFLLNDNETVVFKHNLPGTSIQYTLDGKEPDSANAAFYKEPIALTGYSILKARAVKAGWFSSATVTHHFFKKGLAPPKVELLSKVDKDYRGEGAGTLTDNKKGDKDNFRDIGWLGFRDNPAIALFSFEEAQAIKTITISYHKNIGSYLMPPASIELWAGNAVNQLKLIRKETPSQPKAYEPNAVPGIILATDQTAYRYYKLIITPVAKLPAWHDGKGKKGWVFLDEVIFE